MSKLMTIGLAGLLAASLTGAALAQTAPATAAMPAPAAMAGAPTLDTPIESLVANPAAKAVLDRDLPGVTTHPAYEQFKTMSLNEVAPMSEGKITDAALAKVKADLAKLPAK